MARSSWFFPRLPPATSKPPFVVLPAVIETFDWRVLRQNRRVVKSDGPDRKDEIEMFHRVLNDISLGVASPDVRSFVVGAYVRGASSNCAEQTSFEGSTGVFTKRRYRDRFNRSIVKRVSRECGHQLRVKARVRAKGTRGANWYGESRVAFLRKRCRTQMLWNLTLAGRTPYNRPLPYPCCRTVVSIRPIDRIEETGTPLSKTWSRPTSRSVGT